MIMDFTIEKSYESRMICGVDEVGRGPLAGPVVTCAVIYNGIIIDGIDDSKKLTSRKIEKLAQEIMEHYQYAIGIASVEEIASMNINNATKLAMQRAVEGLNSSVDVVLVDGNMKFCDPRYISIIKGDQKCYSIACASIVAKLHRDTLMRKLAIEHGEYGWDSNVGYGTKQHMEAIRQYGVTKHHRMSFIHL